MPTHTPSIRNYSSARARTPRGRIRQAEPCRRHNRRRDRGRLTYDRRSYAKAWLGLLIPAVVLIAVALIQHFGGTV